MKIPKILQTSTIKASMQALNDYGLGILFIVDQQDTLVGLVTDGDIRRAILSGESLQHEIRTVMNKNPIVIYQEWSRDKIEKFLNTPETRSRTPKFKALIIPVLDKEKKIIDIEVCYIDKTRIKTSRIAESTMQITPKKILVIGGAGYIGSVLIRLLLENGYTVKIMDNLLYGDKGIHEIKKNKNLEFFKGEITNISEVVEAIRDVDSIVHLAAIVGDPASKLKPRETLEINYFATRTLVDVAKYLGISKFIFASTCSVYGFGEEQVDEESEPNPLSTYAETKLLSEKVVLDYEGDGFCPVVLRFATVYGLSPRMRFDLVVNLLIAKAIVDKEITVFGQGNQYRPFVHVKDIAQAILKVIQAPVGNICGEIFNVGSNEQNIRISELAHQIHDGIPDAEITFVKEKEDERSYFVSFAKIKEKLDFKPTMTLNSAIKEISQALNDGTIVDYKDKKYSNHRSLKEG